MPQRLASGSRTDHSFHQRFCGKQNRRHKEEFVQHRRDHHSLKDVTHYNNYYEFSTDKDGPADLAKNFRTRPWKVKIEGAVEKKQELDVDEIIKMAPPEERIYRHRCVEGWSIVVPWVGFSLSELINRAKPTEQSKIRRVHHHPRHGSRCRASAGNVLQWPYVEGLRMDEAMHPLALLCFGMYGEDLPNQDGAPIRLTLPWKYGFKSAKAIVKFASSTSSR